MRALLFALAPFFLIATLHSQETPAIRAGDAMGVIRQGDAFEMRVSGVPSEMAADFAIQYSVGPEGTINVPLIGDVKVSGLTATQAEHAIQAKMIADKIFTRPTVVINLDRLTRLVSVGGGVHSPQRIQWDHNLTLNSAVNVAGGPDDYADEKRVRLIRDGKIVGSYDLRVLRKDPSRDPKLSPGDQVFVPK